MKKPVKRRQSKLINLGEKLTQTLDIPETAVPGTSHLEVTGGREIIVDGCKGVLQYDEETIRLNTGRLIIRIRGSELFIRSMQDEQALISGQILSIDFTS